MSPEKAEAASPERLLQRRSSRSLTDAEEEEESAGSCAVPCPLREAEEALAPVAMATDVLDRAG